MTEIIISLAKTKGARSNSLLWTFFNFSWKDYIQELIFMLFHFKVIYMANIMPWIIWKLTQVYGKEFSHFFKGQVFPTLGEGVGFTKEINAQFL